MQSLKKLSKDFAHARYTIFHPFNGFWEIKREGKGSLPFAVLTVVALVVVYIIRFQYTGFILNYNDKSEMNLITQITGVVLPVILWCVANWCISTLVDGEQTMKEIFISTSYCLLPLILFNIPMVILSNVITIEESMFYSILDVISILWAALLILFSNMTINQFTFGRTVLAIALTLVGMIVIVIVAMLFFSVFQQFYNFMLLLFQEIIMR